MNLIQFLLMLMVSLLNNDFSFSFPVVQALTCSKREACYPDKKNRFLSAGKYTLRTKSKLGSVRDDVENSLYAGAFVPSSIISIHHVALKTRNITASIQFYGLIGFEVVCKFRAGPARAAWIELYASESRSPPCKIEIIEVPSHMLLEEPGVARSRAPDLMNRQNILGYNHLALDVTLLIKCNTNDALTLQDWINDLDAKSVKQFGKTLRIALQPRQQMIGQSIYEVAFLYDPDGCLIELLHLKSSLPQQVDSGWEPWDGRIFVQ